MSTFRHLQDTQSVVQATMGQIVSKVGTKKLLMVTSSDCKNCLWQNLLIGNFFKWAKAFLVRCCLFLV